MDRRSSDAGRSAELARLWKGLDLVTALDGTTMVSCLQATTSSPPYVGVPADGARPLPAARRACPHLPPAGGSPPPSAATTTGENAAG